jgi:hypothetical protein
MTEGENLSCQCIALGARVAQVAEKAAELTVSFPLAGIKSENITPYLLTSLSVKLKEAPSEELALQFIIGLSLTVARSLDFRKVCRADDLDMRAILLIQETISVIRQGRDLMFITLIKQRSLAEEIIVGAGYMRERDGKADVAGAYLCLLQAERRLQFLLPALPRNFRLPLAKAA